MLVMFPHQIVSVSKVAILSRKNVFAVVFVVLVGPTSKLKSKFHTFFGVWGFFRSPPSYAPESHTLSDSLSTCILVPC